MGAHESTARRNGRYKVSARSRDLARSAYRLVADRFSYSEVAFQLGVSRSYIAQLMARAPEGTEVDWYIARIAVAELRGETLQGILEDLARLWRQIRAAHRATLAEVDDLLVDRWTRP